MPITVQNAESSESFKIPSATKFIQQTSEWVCPVVENGETALIKCCINHEAIDFIVVDFSVPVLHSVYIQLDQEIFMHVHNSIHGRFRYS